jgi:hypothetical protein
MLSISDDDFRNLIKPEYKDDYEKIAWELFEDEQSETHQSGLFKLEGLYLLALFRTIKCYLLENEVERRVRLRSIPTRMHSGMESRIFTQNPDTNAAVVRTTCMRPTEGLEVCLMRESRTVSNSLNAKRCQIVRKKEFVKS